MSGSKLFQALDNELTAICDIQLAVVESHLHRRQWVIGLTSDNIGSLQPQVLRLQEKYRVYFRT